MWSSSDWYVITYILHLLLLFVLLGKTAIVHVIKYGKFEQSDMFPTIGVDFQQVSIGTITLRAWEPAGRSHFRVITESYYRNAKSFIFVIDSSNRVELDDAHKELHRMKDEGRFENKPLLILANKQDLPDAMSVDEIREKLALNEFNQEIVWHLQGASAVENKGIQEGFEWLASQINTSIGVMKPIVETINDSIVMKNHILSVFSFKNCKEIFNKWVRFGHLLFQLK